MDGIGCDQHISLAILDIGRGGEHVMHAGAVRDPLPVDQVGGEIERRVPPDVEVLVGYKIRPRGWAEAASLDRLRLDRRMVVGRAPTFEERADTVREP